MPEVGVLAQHAAWWDEALINIPSEDLDEVYLRAISTHTSAFPLGTGDMIAAWQVIQTERDKAARFAATQEYLADTRERAQANAAARVLDLQEKLKDLA
jgi:hypothetical protein